MSIESRKKRVLVIEDDRFILDSLVELLSDENFEVMTALNGQEGLDLLRTTSVLPDMILLDLMMPVKDGFQFREEQNADPKISEIPVVLMSADGHLEEKKKRIGIKHHLKKPVDVDDILEMIQKICN